MVTLTGVNDSCVWN